MGKKRDKSKIRRKKKVARRKRLEYMLGPGEPYEVIPEYSCYEESTGGENLHV